MNQLLVMMFGQLSNRDSLRDLTSIISAHSNKAYHLGFGKNVTRSNLAKVNERREPRIFEEFAYHMIDIARRKRIYKEFEIEGKVFADRREGVCLRLYYHRPLSERLLVGKVPQNQSGHQDAYAL